MARQQDPLKQPRRGRRRALWIILSIILVIALAVGGYFFYLAQSYNTKRTVIDPFKMPVPSVTPSVSASPTPPPLSGDAVGSQNILLLGSDTRSKQKLNKPGDQRSDTIMVMHIDAEHKHVYVMSILRDSWVDIPGYGYNKVNAALAYGGLPLTVRTVEQMIDAPIDQVAVIDFQGFRDLSTALGGVTVNNTQAFKDYGYKYPKGKITLKGDRALLFVRERHAFSNGDYQRVKNQQAFIKGVLTKFLDKGTLTNPVTISNTINAISPYLTTSPGLDAAYLGGLAWDMREIKLADVHFFTAPTTGTGFEGNQSVVYVDEAKLKDLQHLYRADALEKYKRDLTFSG